MKEGKNNYFSHVIFFLFGGNIKKKFFIADTVVEVFQQNGTFEGFFCFTKEMK